MYPLFKFINTNYLQKIFEARDIQRVNFGDIVGLLSPMNKIGHPTYLSNDKESFIIAASEIEGGHGLPLESNYFLGSFSKSSSM